MQPVDHMDPLYPLGQDSMHGLTVGGILTVFGTDSFMENDAMTHKGHVENGVIVLDDPTELPDGMVVEVRPARISAGRHHPDVERFAGVIAKDAGDEEQYFEHLKKKHQ